MRISIIARINEEDCPPKAGFYDCLGYRGCCFVDACKSNGCPRGYIVVSDSSSMPQSRTTIASVAAPVLASAIASISSVEMSSTTVNKAQASTTSRGATTTVPIPTETGGGAWYTDPNARPTSTIVSVSSSLISTPIETPALNTSTPAPEPKSDDEELSGGAKGAIIAAVLVLIVAAIASYFLCGKQRRKLRLSGDAVSSISRSGSKCGMEEDKGHLPVRANPCSPDNIFSTIDGRYEEPQIRFNRVSDMSSSSRMMNHPIGHNTRESVMLPPPSAVIARSTMASPELTSCAAIANTDFISRMGTATPELQGPPQQAAVAELASPGLPKVVEIHSSRSGEQMYKPYRPNGYSLYPVAETTPNYLTGTMNATDDERLKNKYVTYWTRWDPAA